MQPKHAYLQHKRILDGYNLVINVKKCFSYTNVHHAHMHTNIQNQINISVNVIIVPNAYTIIYVY